MKIRAIWEKKTLGRFMGQIPFRAKIWSFRHGAVRWRDEEEEKRVFVALLDFSCQFRLSVPFTFFLLIVPRDNQVSFPHRIIVSFHIINHFISYLDNEMICRYTLLERGISKTTQERNR